MMIDRYFRKSIVVEYPMQFKMIPVRDNLTLLYYPKTNKIFAKSLMSSRIWCCFQLRSRKYHIDHNLVAELYKENTFFGTLILKLPCLANKSSKIVLSLGLSHGSYRQMEDSEYELTIYYKDGTFDDCYPSQQDIHQEFFREYHDIYYAPTRNYILDLRPVEDFVVKYNITDDIMDKSMSVSLSKKQVETINENNQTGLFQDMISVNVYLLCHRRDINPYYLSYRGLLSISLPRRTSRNCYGRQDHLYVDLLENSWDWSMAVRAILNHY